MTKIKATKAEPTLVACYDFNRRTCLKVWEGDGVTKYIPLDITEGLEVLSLSTTEFDRRFQPMVNYPAVKAAQLYLGYGLTIGGTDEALDFLASVITITPQERDMATAKKRAAKAATEDKAAKVAKKAAKAAGTKPAKKAVKEPGEKRETAAQLFQALIMEGKLTDDQIFAKVKAKFGLDDKKRGYVKWYRNHLKKAGTKNVPDAKE